MMVAGMKSAVFCVIVCLVGYVAATCPAMQSSGTTTMCGDKYCSSMAQCDTDVQKCKCVDRTNPYSYGSFCCYEPDYIRTEMRCDPTVITFDNERLPMHYPCRPPVTFFQQRLPKTINSLGATVDVGWCKVKVFVNSFRRRGKIYVGGADIFYKIVYDDLRDNIMSTVRINGTANNGQYSYYCYDTGNNRKPFGPFDSCNEDVSYENITIRKCQLDAINNFVSFRIPECGFEVKFRAWDSAFGIDQKQTPGLSVAVEKREDLKFSYTGGTTPSPVAYGGQTMSEIYTGTGLDNVMSLEAFYAALNIQSMPSFSVPDDAFNEKCTDLKQLLDNTDANSVQIGKIVDACYWIIKKPTFGRCVSADSPDGDATAILSTFYNCIRSLLIGTSSCVTEFLPTLADCKVKLNSPVVTVPELNDFTCALDDGGI